MTAPSARTAPGARTFTVIAFVLAGLSVLIAPIVLGPLALGSAVVARVKGDPMATWAMAAAVAGAVAGIALGYVAFSAFDGAGTARWR